MENRFLQTVSLSLGAVGAAFLAAGILLYGFGRVTERNSVSAYGTLTAFRKYYGNTAIRDSGGIDYESNRGDRMPVVRILVDGEYLDIAAVTADKNLTEADIGRSIRVRYKKGFGISLVVDEHEAMKKYNRQQNVRMGILIFLGLLFLMPGVLIGIFAFKVSRG